MNPSRRYRAMALALAILASSGLAVHAQPPLTARSLYHLQVKLTDQRGKAFELASLRGSPVLATMFYASCKSICPMLVAQVKRVHDALPPELRTRVHVLLVSLDPEHDDPEHLRELAKRHAIDDPRWHFVRSATSDVREIAAALGVRYRALPNGELSHTPSIALLDREGELAMRLENASGDPTELIAAATRAAQ